jgi:hypothetical protein
MVNTLSRPGTNIASSRARGASVVRRSRATSPGRASLRCRRTEYFRRRSRRSLARIAPDLQQQPTAQPGREASLFGLRPKHLIRDNDRVDDRANTACLVERAALADPRPCPQSPAAWSRLGRTFLSVAEYQAPHSRCPTDECLLSWAVWRPYGHLARQALRARPQRPETPGLLAARAPTAAGPTHCPGAPTRSPRRNRAAVVTCP